VQKKYLDLQKTRNSSNKLIFVVELRTENKTKKIRTKYLSLIQLVQHTQVQNLCDLALLEYFPQLHGNNCSYQPSILEKLEQKKLTCRVKGLTEMLATSKKRLEKSALMKK